MYGGRKRGRLMGFRSYLAGLKMHINHSPLIMLSYHRLKINKARMIEEYGRPKIDDSDDRRRIWEILFPGEPMPEKSNESNLAEKYFGTFDKDLRKDINLEELLDELNH